MLSYLIPVRLLHVLVSVVPVMVNCLLLCCLHFILYSLFFVPSFFRIIYTYIQTHLALLLLKSLTGPIDRNRCSESHLISTGNGCIMTRSTIVVRTTGRAVQVVVVVAQPPSSTHCHAVRYRNYVIRLVLLSMLVLIDRSGENSVTTTTMYVSAAAAAAASSFLIATDQYRNDGRYRRWTSGCRIMSLSFPPNEPSESYSLGHINNNNNNNDMKQYRSQRWIVLVDDEASIRQAVGQLLIESGYQVTLCQDGSEALRVSLNGQPSLGSSSVVVSTTTTTTSRTTASTVTTTKLPRPAPRAVPDVIVSDVRMPIMDGLTLLKQIRSHPQLVPIPVILLTAKSMVRSM